MVLTAETQRTGRYLPVRSPPLSPPETEHARGVLPEKNREPIDS